MKKTAILLFSAYLTLGIGIFPCATAGAADSQNVSLRTDNDDAYQQTILEFLMPQIDQAVSTYYKRYFNYLPGVAPY